MPRILKLLVQLPPLLFALIFGAQGIMWLIRPSRAAQFWGLDVPDGGLALSSMISAMSALAFTLALCLVIALIRKDRFWYYPPMMMFGFFALGRIVAAAAHGAPHLPERFIPEMVFVGLIYLASRRVTRSQDA